MKKSITVLSSILLILFVLKGYLFRALICYQEIGQRSDIKITNNNLISKIDSVTGEQEIDIVKVLQIANNITKSELSFTTGVASRDPNILIRTNQANCVGYAAMFNSVANYLINKNALHDHIKSEHKIGQLEFLGINLHQFFDDPFFKDHDYNEIIDLGANQKYYIDPTVSDYLLINRIAVK